MPVAAVWLSSRQVPLYQASADVLLTRPNVVSALTGISDPSLYYQPDRVAQTHAQIARVPEVAERVLKAADVTDRTPGAFLGASSVAPDLNSDLLTFSVVDRDPALAAKLATEYARQFTIYRNELDTGALVRARKEVEARIADLEASGERNSPLYASLVDKEQQLLTIEALQASAAYVVRDAAGAFQTQPRPFRNGVLGLMLGLVLGIGLAFLREALDTRVRSTDELERLGLPLLARLPEPPRRLRSKDRLAMIAEPSGVQAEAFRMLKTNLEFVNLERGARMIMVTSAVEAEGKSTTVANLAVALARSGVRVVLADLDLRRPFLARFFGLEGRPGLTQVALGHVELEEALAQVAVTAGNGRPTTSNDGANGQGQVEGLLKVLPSGPIPPDVGEFVGTETLASILAQLRERADMVLLDAPPLLHVGDAMALSAQVDGLIVTARLNVLRRPMLKELQRILDACPAAKLGFVLTGAEAEDGYGYGGYYSRAHRRAGAEKEPIV